MSFSDISFSKKEKRTIILAVTIGNLLEWYEIYLYVYWAPLIAKLFFNSSEIVNLTNVFLLFALGFLARPLGGIFFGRLGDRIGRRKALILSLAMMIIPTFVTGLLPTHAQIGIFAPIILGVMRVLQAFPAGGELPGAMCYLYESSRLDKRRFMCSWAALGFQMGILISTVETFFQTKHMSSESLMLWGWRLSFLIGGCIGILGLFLRYKLHETPLYKEMMTHEHIVKESIFQVVNKYKKGILIGILYCALNSSAFYLLTVNFPVYFGKVLGVEYSNNLILTMMLLFFISFPLPFFGKLADKYNNRKMLIWSTLGMIILLYPLYYSIIHGSLLIMGIVMFFFSLLFTLLSALIPYILPDLFPTHVRFTCVGLSFNLVDAIVGGFTPVIVLYLLHFTGNQASFCWWLLLCSLGSLIAYIMMKEPKHSSSHPHHHHK